METILRPIKGVRWAMRLLAAVFCVITFVGCDCKDEMADARKKYGSPEETNRYDSGEYHSVSYWWWRQGVNKSFSWGHGEGCKVSTYTFTPIKKPASSSQADSIAATAKLQAYESSGWCPVCP